MLRGLGHEQSPEKSQMWAGLQMCALNSAYLGCRLEECGQEGQNSRRLGSGWAVPAQPGSVPDRGERMELGPALFPWVMLLPLFLSLISPPGPGDCEDLAPADPKSCLLCVLGILLDGLGLGPG